MLSLNPNSKFKIKIKNKKHGTKRNSKVRLNKTKKELN